MIANQKTSQIGQKYICPANIFNICKCDIEWEYFTVESAHTGEIYRILTKRETIFTSESQTILFELSTSFILCPTTFL